MATMKTFGQRVRELRGAKDLSLREFAKKLGDLSAAFLSDVELGRRYPSEKVLGNMARILGVSVDDLQSYDTRPPIDELKRLSNMDPMYGVAFRKMVENNFTATELLEMLMSREKKKKN